MKSIRTVLVSFSLSLAAISGLRAAETPADPSWGKAVDNHILAQKLVNELMAKNPDLLVIGLHATKPGAKDQTMIATNLDRIGKADDDDDKAVSVEHKIILAPNLKESNKFEVQVWLKDANGKQLTAAAGFVFKYKAGDSEIMMFTKALAFRDEPAALPDGEWTAAAVTLACRTHLHSIDADK